MGLERTVRHLQAARESDFEYLRQSLRDAASRFSDLADIIEKNRGYDAVGFLRASADRYNRVANLED